MEGDFSFASGGDWEWKGNWGKADLVRSWVGREANVSVNSEDLSIC